MAIWGAVISGIISTGIKLLGSAGGPNYPSLPQLHKIPIQKAKNFMEDYEAQRMGSSIAAWQSRFPLLKAGGDYLINDLIQNQQGKLSPTIKNALTKSGLETPVETDQYAQAKDLGLNPLTLSQRTSQAVVKNIGDNPEWSNQISGGTLATMIANNYQNQNAFTQFLGANATARSIASGAANAGTTQALLAGLTGTARAGYQAYQNSQPFNLGTYYQGNIYGTTPNYGGGGGSAYTAPQVQTSTGPMFDVSGPPAQPNNMYYDWLNSGTGGGGAPLPDNPWNY